MEKNELHLYGDLPDSLKNNNSIDLNLLNKTPIRKIVSGKNHCLILFGNDELFGFGRNDNGQLGLPISKDNNLIEDIRRLRLNIPNMSDYKIIDIASGDDFSLLLVYHKKVNYLMRLSIKKEDIYMNDFENIQTIVKYVNSE